MSDTFGSREMPRYSCHKEVWALKIAQLTHTSTGELIEDGDEFVGNVTITPVEEGYAPFEVDAAYMTKHQPRSGGYYVVYKDGYKSYSPAKAFEEGYSPTT